MYMILSQEEYEVLTARYGKSTKKILNNEAVDLIVVNLTVPEMDDIEFLHWLRPKSTLTTSTLVPTGIAKVTTKAKVMAAGTTALICKPLKAPDLLVQIKPMELAL